MATVKKGMLTSAGEWWKHLRWMKRTFWKGERKAAERDVKERVDETSSIEHEIETEMNEVRDLVQECIDEATQGLKQDRLTK